MARAGYKPGLKDWAASNGLAWDTLQTQAWFFMYETQRDFPLRYAELVAGVKPLATLTANIEKFYERPATLADVKTRIKYANDTLALMKGVQKKPPVTLPPVVKTGAAATGATNVVIGIHWMLGAAWAAGFAAGFVAAAGIYIYVNRKTMFPGSAQAQVKALVAERDAWQRNWQPRIEAALTKLRADAAEVQQLLGVR